MAVFALDDETPESERRSRDSHDIKFAFTASRPERAGADKLDLNDLDRHVSFAVEVVNRYDPVPPELRIRRWLSGLCFFGGESRRDVVFPWPKDLEMIGP